MSSAFYPKRLIPDHEKTYVVEGIPYSIPVVNLSLIRWTGTSLNNTFGSKPLIEYEGKPMFAELVIQRITEQDGWSSRWVATYASQKNNPYYLTNWLDKPLNLQKNEPLNDLNCENLITKIFSENNNSFSGCWDVFAWKGSRTLFIESKRLKRDSFRISQLRWFKTALSAGLTINNFLIVQWDFKNN